MDDVPDIAWLAEWMSKSQKSAIKQLPVGGEGKISVPGTCGNEIVRKGIAVRRYPGKQQPYLYTLTPLGLAVRAALQEMER